MGAKACDDLASAGDAGSVGVLPRIGTIARLIADQTQREFLMRYRSAVAMFALLCAADSSEAQTVLAPSGDSAVTQPGGVEGRAAQRNLDEAIRNGDVVGTVPGRPRRESDEPVILREDARRRNAE